MTSIGASVRPSMREWDDQNDSVITEAKMLTMGDSALIYAKILTCRCSSVSLLLLYLTVLELTAALSDYQWCFRSEEVLTNLNQKEEHITRKGMQARRQETGRE